LTTKYQQCTINHLRDYGDLNVSKGKDDKGKEVLHECVFVGTHDATAMQPLEQKPVPPSADFARNLALSILCGIRGRYRSSRHFAEQMTVRGFDIFDMEYAIRNGQPVGFGEYCDEHKDFKYLFRGNIDGTDFDAVFSFSAEHDFVTCPLMILITGCWKTKSGKRRKTY
jgi:hypothetical protein